MLSIADISFQAPVEPTRSQRNALLKELYALYTSQPETNKKENRKRYYQYCRLHHPAVCRKANFSKELYDQYKDEFREAILAPQERYLKAVSEKSHQWWGKFTHCKEEELNYMISVAKDKLWRKECVAKYIMGSVKLSTGSTCMKL